MSTRCETIPATITPAALPANASEGRNGGMAGLRSQDVTRLVGGSSGGGVRTPPSPRKRPTRAPKPTPAAKSHAARNQALRARRSPNFLLAGGQNPQPLAHLVHGPRHHRLRDAEHLARFRVAQAPFEHEEDRNPHFIRKPAQRLPKPERLALPNGGLFAHKGDELGIAVFVAWPGDSAAQHVARH